ncbi:hypothetical protein ACEK07_46070 [Alcanivoracaceae bacterium MT1]
MVDVKREIHDAYALFKLQRQGAGGDALSGRIYGMARNVWAGKVMAAVENQPRPLGDLLLMCYAPEWEVRSLDVIRACLWAEFLKCAGDEIKQDRTLRKTKAMTEVAIFDYQAQARGSSFPIEMVCQMLGIDQSNWYKQGRKWRAWYEKMGEILHHWERKALQQPREICEEIAALRQIEREKMTVP